MKREIISLLYPAKSYSTAQAKAHAQKMPSTAGIKIKKAQHIGQYIHVKFAIPLNGRKIRTFQLGKGILAHYAVPMKSKYLKRKKQNPESADTSHFLRDYIFPILTSFAIGYYFHKKSQNIQITPQPIQSIAYNPKNLNQTDNPWVMY